MSQIAKIKIEKSLKETILEAINQIGGFESFINRGEVVLLKPNFNTADPFPASSDSEFLKAVIDLTYEAGAKTVFVGDSCTMSMNTRKVMEKLGVFDLETREQSARAYVFEERKWINKEIPGAKYLKSAAITEILERSDKLILLPCLKTHSYAQFTGSLKLAVGFMKPIQRIQLHTSHLQEKIAELNTIINPVLIIMDARKCFINRGPSEGTLAEPGLILASDNRVAIDIEGIKIIQSYKGNSLEGIDPTELPQIKRAIELGLGP